MKKITVVIAALLLVACTAFTAFAEEAVGSAEAVYTGGTFAVSTQYPSRVLKAGTSPSFSLDFVTSENQLTELSVDKLPDGWKAAFTGDGSTISSIYLKKGETEGAASLKLEIPAETAGGSYEVRVKASSSAGSSLLSLSLDVEAEELGESGLVIEYNSQEGNSSTTFSFSTTIQNNTAEDQNYSLTASAPKGWTTSFVADSTQVAAVIVPARSSQNLTVNITPSAGTEAGEYTVPVSAISATENLKGELQLTITGTYEASLSTPSGRLSFDATANKQSTVTVSVTNNGNIDLKNLNLTSTAPTGWTVEYSESTIDTLEAGATKEITVYVTPASDALSGDYAMSLTARNAETSASEAFRITVKTETKWGIVGALIILLALAGLGL